MKVSEELNTDLKTISKEVEAWPLWKRSIDQGAHQRLHATSAIDEARRDDKPDLAARVAKV